MPATRITAPEQYPAAEIAGLYRRHRRIGVDRRQLRRTRCLDVLEARAVDTIPEEVQASMRVYDLTRPIMF